MPKTNRPLVKDGRIQVQKKRTDRSYLRPSSTTPDIVPVEDADEAVQAEIEPEASAVEAPATEAPVTPSARPMSQAATAAPTRQAAPASNKLPTTVRALQQQGVRKRRDVDLGALARRDTSYALHELRRITILATMVIIALIVAWIVLR